MISTIRERKNPVLIDLSKKLRQFARNLYTDCDLANGSIRYFRDLDADGRRQIWERLNSRQYYLMTGSGVSLDTVGLNGTMRTASKLNSDLCELTKIASNRMLQQAYSLLEPAEVYSEITQHYTTVKPGATIRALAHVPWRRVYTLNVDNAFEAYVADLFKDRLIDSARSQVFNFSDDYRDTLPDTIQSIVHLHGTVERPGDGYVFSQSEYAKNISRPNSWMTTLTQLMRAEPFIVAGTTLDEADVTFYLQQRPAENHVFVPESPSILIEPFPDRLTERLCQNHDFVLFDGTCLSFIDAISAEFGTLNDAFALRHADAGLPQTIKEVDRIRFEETFERVPSNPTPTKETARFLLGASPSWEMLAGNVDVQRDIFSKLDSKILSSQKSKINFVVILDDPGSGKSAILRRLALSYSRRVANVFYFKGREYLDEESAGDILMSLAGHVYIFADNIADNIAYLVGVLQNSYLDRITIIGTERKYRARYIEDAVADFDLEIIDSELNLSAAEARRLIRKHMAIGLSDIDTTSEKAVQTAAKSLAGDPITIATCRIQNNFFAFDRIVKDLIAGSDANELRTYAAVGIARYCYAGGVSRDVLSSMPGLSRNNQIGDLYSKLPMSYAANSREYVIPARTAVSERVIESLRINHQDLLLETMVGLANALAIQVNRDAIRRRTPASKLASGLIDFDRAVQRFVNTKAESFYEQISDQWDWNARYWEQLALLKLDRYFHSRDDELLLQEAIQNARYAYSIERHPLSLTTLAKSLFSAIEARVGDKDAVFGEAWSMITQSIDIEKRWDRIRSTAFIVCFRGVKNYVNVGGMLTGIQADELRDIISKTHTRKLKDKKMQELREEALLLIS